MKMNERGRAKRTAKAATLLPAGSQLRVYAEGRAHARVGGRVIAVVGAIAAVMMVGLLLGRLLIPGVLLVFYVFYLVRPPRALGVTDNGIALFHRSFWTGAPSSLMCVDQAPQITPGSGSRVVVGIDGEQVTLSAQQSNHLSSAMAGLGRSLTQWEHPR
jgi:hypothetical protein